MIGNLAFVLLGKATVQPWNDTTKHLTMDHEISRIPGGPLTQEIVEEEKKDEKDIIIT